MDFVEYMQKQNMAFKKELWKKLRSFIKYMPDINGKLTLENIKEMAGRTLTINPSEVRLFYSLLNKDLKEEEKKMNESVHCEHDLPSEEKMACVTRAEKEARKITCLYDTSELMVSGDYKTRFVAEYFQTKIRYEKLKAFNTKIEASRRTREPDYMGNPSTTKKVEEPRHDCPVDMLRAQERAMEEYLHILEVRAVIEEIDLDYFK